ncbi:hypothetical protein FA95DRAFT_1038209 [Auriscalpium vulgare]|uniref:Uncharacterized protein n=1 Tax=Auriscalpium vulgare TaxID=40419 RepID=A0ACB8RWX4_9AGAM|nr:hypothetical protein FA95DRAFT_1038209 [Auriscalpium vulgare]
MSIVEESERQASRLLSVSGIQERYHQRMRIGATSCVTLLVRQMDTVHRHQSHRDYLTGARILPRQHQPTFRLCNSKQCSSLEQCGLPAEQQAVLTQARHALPCNSSSSRRCRYATLRAVSTR